MVVVVVLTHYMLNTRHCYCYCLLSDVSKNPGISKEDLTEQVRMVLNRAHMATLMQVMGCYLFFFSVFSIDHIT